VSVRILLAIGGVAVTTGLALALDAEVSGAGLLLLLAVVVASLLGRTPGLVAGVAGAISYSYFFIPPERSFSLGKDTEFLALAIYVATAAVVGTLVARSAELRLAAEAREAEAVERLSLVQRLQEAEQEASRARGAAEVNQARAAFFAAAGHNLRTPLTTVATAADALSTADEQLTPAERAELLETLRVETSRLARLVDRVLEVSRVKAGLTPDREVVDIEGLVQVAVRRLGPLLGGRDVDLVVDPDGAEALVDVTLMEEVFLNLLENALRYTPASTPIEIRSQRVGAEVVVRVIDHGPGIPATDRERVFEEFYRGDHDADQGPAGTGLGLAIVRALIDAQGGSVRCLETPGGGATIELRLPAAPRSDDPPSP
jgi:two-component system sensor histidine kinase KdpD